MAAVDEILLNLPIDRLAQQVGAEPQEVQQAVQTALPALLGGLQANAQGGGSSSIVEALGQHDDDLLAGGVDLDQVDRADGELPEVDAAFEHRPDTPAYRSLQSALQDQLDRAVTDAFSGPFLLASLLELAALVPLARTRGAPL
jgi:hypothetical protein